MIRFYRFLLYLYPTRFREEMGEEMVGDVRDRSREARYGGVVGRVRLVAFLAQDLTRSVARAWARQWTMRGTRHEEGRTMGTAEVLQDLKFALRGFRRRPGFYVVAAATLAVGVGATTAIFSLVDGMLLRPLPYDEPTRIVQIGTLYEGLDRLASSSPLDFFDWQERSRSLEAAAASRLERMTLLGQDEPRQVEGAGVSAEYFDVLGVEPALGRRFTPAEDQPGAAPVAVLSHPFWRQLGGDPSIPGRTLALDGRTFTVVGVMGADFHPPEAIYHQDVDVWYPLALIRDPLDLRDAGFLQVLGRLAPGVSPATAELELSAIERSLAEASDRSNVAGVGVEPLRAVTLGDVGDTLWLVLGAVALLLLIACANVANLFLVRATERDREMAVRSSLGATDRRLTRQLLTESLGLAAVSAVLATALAHGLVRAFVAWSPTALPRISEVAVDVRALGFALLLSLLTGMLFGLVPVLGTRGARRGALRTGGRAGSGGAGPRRPPRGGGGAGGGGGGWGGPGGGGGGGGPAAPPATSWWSARPRWRWSCSSAPGSC